MVTTASFAFDLSLSYGPILIGSFIAAAFWGAQCIQTFYYFMNYSKDPTLVKIWMMLLLGLDTAHIVFLIKGIWLPLISQYGDFNDVFGIRPELVYQVLTTAVVAFMAQCYFAWRIYMFGNKPAFKWGIPALLAPLIVWQVVGSIIYTARGLSLKSTTQLASLSQITIGLNLSAAAVDVVITFTTCVLLYFSRNGIPSTDRLLGWLMISSLNTGAWPALFTIVTVILIITTSPDDILYSVTNFPLCALYCNTILGNLTVRNFFHNHTSTTPASSIPLHSMNFRQTDNSQFSGQVDKILTLNSIPEDARERESKSHGISGQYAV